MNKKILFTPVGGSDPISNERDGSILHICRIYKPDDVYLFFSKEMYDNHMKDNRYLYCIEKLGELLNHKFECHLIFEKDLTEVQQYDIFYHIFQREIGIIKEKMDDTDILYLNTSSGTPGMKSALFIMSTLGDYQMVSLQVSTPKKSINPHFEVSDKNYDIKLYWEFNEDNKEDIINRCSEVKSLNLVKMFKMDLVKKHILAFNYNAAYDVAMTIEGIENEKVYLLLMMAKKRSQLFMDEAGKLSRETGISIFPVNEGNYRKVFEYAMVVWLKQQRGEYADYIRALTPLIEKLYECILKKEYGIDINEITSEEVKKKKTKSSLSEAGKRKQTAESHIVKVWDKQKILNKKPEIAQIFDNEYRGAFSYKEVSSIHIVKIINNLSSDDVLKMKISDMTDVEQNIRNIAAHTITTLSDEDIKQKVGKNAAQIFEMIKYFCVKAGMSIKEGAWNTYIDMNEYIINEIENMTI